MSLFSTESSDKITSEEVRIRNLDQLDKLRTRDRQSLQIPPGELKIVYYRSLAGLLAHPWEDKSALTRLGVPRGWIQGHEDQDPADSGRSSGRSDRKKSSMATGKRNNEHKRKDHMHK